MESFDVFTFLSNSNIEDDSDFAAGKKIFGVAQWELITKIAKYTSWTMSAVQIFYENVFVCILNNLKIYQTPMYICFQKHCEN